MHEDETDFSKPGYSLLLMRVTTSPNQECFHGYVGFLFERNILLLLFLHTSDSTILAYNIAMEYVQGHDRFSFGQPPFRVYESMPAATPMAPTGFSMYGGGGCLRVWERRNGKSGARRRKVVTKPVMMDAILILGGMRTRGKKSKKTARGGAGKKFSTPVPFSFFSQSLGSIVANLSHDPDPPALCASRLVFCRTMWGEFPLGAFHCTQLSSSVKEPPRAPSHPGK